MRITALRGSCPPQSLGRGDGQAAGRKSGGGRLAMPGLGTCRNSASNQSMLAGTVCVFWEGCPLILGDSQGLLGDLGLAR